MRRAALFLALLAPLLAEAQPYATAGEALYAMGCRWVRVCEDIPHLDGLCNRREVTAFRPEIPFDPLNPWPRYGWPEKPEWPFSIGDGMHPGSANVMWYALHPSNPLQLVQPYSWDAGGRDGWDGSKTWTATEPCRNAVDRLLDQLTGATNPGGEPSPPPCPFPWKCGDLPEAIRVGCISGDLHCSETRGIAFMDPRCYNEAGKVLGRPWVQYSTRCSPSAPPPPPPPPSPLPPPLCPNGVQDPGETCESCPADMPAGACEVPPPPPPPPTGCGEALDAQATARAALTEAQATEAAAWAAVVRECRP